MDRLGYDKDYAQFISFGDDPFGRHMAGWIADLTINWGRIEYSVYLLLDSIDPKRGREWTQAFFKTVDRKKKEATVRKEVLNIIRDYPEFHSTLERTFVDLDVLCGKRNTLSHGLWKRTGPQTYEVQPLRLDRLRKGLEAAISVGSKEMGEINRLVSRVIQGLAVLSSELLAHQYLEKHGRGRRSSKTESQKSNA